MRDESIRNAPRAGLAHVVRWTALLTVSPYVGLVGYLRWQMHAESVTASAPGAGLLAVMAVLGVVLPAFGVVSILRRLIEERERFLLRPLLQAYVCLIFVFASGYALLQTSGGVEASFRGMVQPWVGEATFWEHLAGLHALFLDALYLSIVTITTVGFGDLVPVTAPAKLLAAAEGLIGIGYIGLVLGHYFSVCKPCGSVPRAVETPQHEEVPS